MANSGKVETVLGPIDPEELGHTLPHEHVLIDLTAGSSDVRGVLGHTDSMLAAATPETGRLDRLGTIDIPASRSTSWTEQIRLDNLYDQVKNWLFYGHTFAMSSIDDATYAVGLFRDTGGSCIVDVTVVGMGRDPEGLQIVSRRTGVHIVMATGFYLDTYHPSSAEDMSEEELAEFMIAEIEEGVHQGGAKPGMIGEMGYRLGHPLEEKALRSALRASIATGLPVTIHPGEPEESMLAAARIVAESGVDPARVIMAHVDSRAFTDSEYLEVAATGLYLSLDAFGRETSVRQRGPHDLPNDATRINSMMALAKAGYADRVVMSHDAALKWMHRRYGGWGYHHILETAIPLMRYKEVPEELIKKFSVDNPVRVLTIE
jgi:phosphotriesterase-related protein